MIPDFTSKEQAFDWLRANKGLVIAAKKAMVKHADAVIFQNFTTNSHGQIEKAVANTTLLSLPEFPVDIVINTTYIRDSHKDVHIDGLWTKSLNETKIMYHIQEHRMSFDKVISDRVKAYTKKVQWSELGYPYTGMTEALIFNSMIEVERNPFMAEQYAKGRVKNHSVGMRYVKIDMAMNSESKFDKEEKAVWDKYIDKIANREEVEEDGYFWAVTEAKVIEGSAVLMGSNFATPTLNIGESPKSLNAADEITAPEPMDWAKIAEAIKHNKN